MPAGETDYRRYLDPAVIARLSGLALRARLIVEGYYAGSHRSPYRGRSVEFADHRPYSQGDDLRHIDWKVYGRTNKFYIKEFEQETNLNLLLAVDVSESMAFGADDAPLSKHDYASAAAAALACLALQQHDSVGLIRFADKVIEHHRPSNSPGQWRTLVRALDQGVGAARSNLRGVFEEIAESIERRSLLVVISDLLDDPEGIIRGLRHLRFRRHDVVVLQILDASEVEFPFQADTLFDGLEGHGRLTADAAALRSAYLDEFAAFSQQLRVGCRSLHFDWAQITTATALDAALSSYLGKRAANLKSRHAAKRKGA
jgi:uncharacterized protein (DUF58 family)